VGSRAGLDDAEKIKFLTHRASVVQPLYRLLYPGSLRVGEVLDEIRCGRLSCTHLPEHRLLLCHPFVTAATNFRAP
jgi:hypothetical protein